MKGRAPGDEHDVGRKAGDVAREIGGDQAEGRAQASPDAVALRGMTDALRDGETEPETVRAVRLRSLRRPQAPLRGHPLGVEPTSFGGCQEVGPLLEPLDRRHRWFDPG
jgi:hypothetical protein